MTNPSLFEDEWAQTRTDLVAAAVRELAPPHSALATLDRGPDDLARLPDGALTPDRMARLWGQLQLVMVDCGVDGMGRTGVPEVSAAWLRVRRSAETVFQALLHRAEWMSLQVDLHEEVLPRFAEAVPLSRAGRLARCREAIGRLRMLAQRTSGLPHAWRIARITRLAYPDVTPTGWQGRQGEECTEPRVRAVARALLERLREDGLGALPLVVGYDSRVHADQLAMLVADTASRLGQPVRLCAHDCAAPALVTYGTEALGVGNTAGIILSTASRLPITDPSTGQYTGNEYQGLRYYTAYGTPPTVRLTERISRRAAELLLDVADADAGADGEVIMIQPREDYLARLHIAMGFPVTMPDAQRPVCEAMREYWRQPQALIVIDGMYGAARDDLRAVCERLKLPCELLHGERDPLFGGLQAASPEPPNINELIAHIKEKRSEHHPLIGLAFDADGNRVGVVDETGTYRSANTVLALLTDFLLNEAYPGTPGMIIRCMETTRLLDRLAALPEYVGRTLPPPAQDRMPAYVHAPEYRRLFGDPTLLHGGELFVVRDDTEVARLVFHNIEVKLERRRRGELSPAQMQEAFHEDLERMLVAGDGQGALLARGHAPAADGPWTALLLLHLCAVRRAQVGELWHRLQARIGPSHTGQLDLHAPDAVKRLLVNRYIAQYELKAAGRPLFSTEQLAGGTVRYAGGMRDRFLECALNDAEGHPAYLFVQARDREPAIRVSAESSTPEFTHRLLLLIAGQLENLLIEELRRAEHPWKVVEVLAELQWPPSALVDLPGTLNCRIAEQAYARLQELARPGREAPELLRFVTDRLNELQPGKGRLLAACHLGEPHAAPPTPPPPRIIWEGDGNEA